MDLDRSSIEYEGAGFISAGDENVEEEADIVSPPWSELPPHIIEKIYSFLDRHNQSKMSLVCRSWANEYGSPSLWRSMILVLPKYEYNAKIYPEVRSARKYGGMFQHVVIFWKGYRQGYNLDFEMWKQLCLFLLALTHRSQLLSLKFINMCIFFKILDVRLKAFHILFEIIKNLILSQKKLRSLEFTNSQFKTAKAVDLLRIICTKISLKELFLQGFVEESNHDEVLENTFEDCSVLENLMNLEVWTVDYSRIFENIMTNFYEYGNLSYKTEKKWKLQKMYLICDTYMTINYLGISSSVWKYIGKVCPDLKVDMTTFNIENKLDLFITRFMPITALDFLNIRNSESDPENVPVLQHLVSCGINENLEELSICFPRTPNLTLDLKNFLKVSPKLRILEFNMVHKIELHTLFNDWLENQPMSLETVRILLRNFMDDGCTIDDLKNFSDLKDKFVPALKKLGLNLTFEGC